MTPSIADRPAPAVNVCVVGHGMMGAWHSNALEGTAAVRHTLVGRRAEPTAEFALSRGFRVWTTSLEEALADDEIDAVIFATPSETHASTALRSLRTGKPVLVEIPLAMNLADAEYLVQEARARGLTLGVVHPLRARAELVELRERVRAGIERVRQVVGRIYLHRLENVGSTGYRRSWTDNLLWHHMAHLVDAALWISDAEPARVESVMSPVDPLTGIPMDVAVLMETELGQPLLCSGSYYGRDRIFDLLVVTDRDSYRLDVFAAALTTDGGTRAIASEEENCWRVTRDFLDALAGGRPPLASGQLVLPAMRALAAVQAQWDREHGKQTMPGRPTGQLDELDLSPSNERKESQDGRQGA
jgi:2-hydroxy-4-carboxymuconate semialdehyde hemiacetal dehydrogenase